jgi:ATP-dependent protease ClpP protease subunit
MFRLSHTQFRPQSRMSSNKYKMTELEDEDLEETCNVRVQDNNIYFFCPVTSETILELTVNIDILSKELQKFAIQYDIEPPPINIYINSEGGEVHAALSVFDTIKNNKVYINTIISGNASSAATIIALAGSKRKITNNSYMLIHNISSVFWGKMHEFEDEMKNMNKLTSNLKRIYKDYGSITKKQLDDLLKKDLLLDSKTCLKYGFVDEIV